MKANMKEIIERLVPTEEGMGYPHNLPGLVRRLNCLPENITFEDNGDIDILYKQNRIYRIDYYIPFGFDENDNGEKEFMDYCAFEFTQHYKNIKKQIEKIQFSEELEKILPTKIFEKESCKI